ncbi:mechanosensitive ion channel family protein [Rhizobium leguminosarum]|uniref:mechanosensitive ion channel family protein n=1 Tax=Rhizobium leguminosarum TaxID=384 RepID=UPI002F93C9D5
MVEQVSWQVDRLAHDAISQYTVLIIVMLLVRYLVQGRPALRLIVHFVFFAMLTAVLVADDVAPWSADIITTDLARRIFLGIAKTTWWIAGATVLVASVRVFLIFERKPREGRLIQDLLVGIIYLSAALAVIAFVFSLPVGTVIVTSGVFAIVLGLALQSTLNDVFSGIALNLGRPYSVGDWISLEDGVQGRVVETNWRATHLLSGSNDLIIVPNSALAKARLTNLTGSDEVHGATVTVRVVPTRRPSLIEEAMRSVLLSANSILKSPPPSVAIVGLDSSAMEVELSFRVPGMSRTAAAKNEIYDLVYRHARAAGIQLGAPPSNRADPDPVPGNPVQTPGTAWRLLNAIPLFATLTEDEMKSLAGSMKRLTFKEGAVIIDQDASMSSLMIIRNGVVVVEREVEGLMADVTRLAPGDLFGERGVLLGAAEPARIRSLTFVVVYQIAKEDLASLMRDRPILAEELGLLLARRIENERQFIDSHRHLEEVQPTSIAEKIRHLFEVPHADHR